MKIDYAFSGFSVDDQEKAVEFYKNVLGLEVEANEMGIHIKLPGGATVFAYPKDNHTPATFTMLNFEVSDIDAAVVELKDKGVTFEKLEGMTGEDGIARGKEQNMGPDIAWFKDPAGNFLAVLQN